MLTCTPQLGTIQAGGKQIVSVKVRPGLPCFMQQVGYFEIAHFEPTAVLFEVEGKYTSVALSLPRANQAAWDEQARKSCLRLQETGCVMLSPKIKKEPKLGKQLEGATPPALAGSCT